MNVEFAKLFFNIANFLFIVGSISLIKDFYRNPIKYKILSVLMTLMAMMNVQIAYLLLEDFISILLAIPTVAYWAIACSYSIYKNYKDKILKFLCSCTHSHGCKVNETRKRSVVKAVSFRIIEFMADVAVIFLCMQTELPQIMIAGISSVLVESSCGIGYYFWERLWNRIDWGREVLQ